MQVYKYPQGRIQDSPRRGRQPFRGVPTYDFAKFREKLHEIGKILGRGGGAGCAPLNPPLIRNSVYVVVL